MRTYITLQRTFYGSAGSARRAVDHVEGVRDAVDRDEGAEARALILAELHLVEHVEPVDAAIGNDPFEAVRLRTQDETIPANQSCSAEPLAISHTITPHGDPPFSERTPFLRLVGLCNSSVTWVYRDYAHSSSIAWMRKDNAPRDGALTPQLFDIGQTKISCFLYLLQRELRQGFMARSFRKAALLSFLGQ